MNDTLAGDPRDSGDNGSSGQPAERFGRLLVERSGGIGGMLLVWDVDIDASSRRDDLGPRIAELPWSDSGQSDDEPQNGGSPQTAGADRFAYLIESRFGRVHFGESQMPPEWKQLVDDVREVAEPQRRQPG